MLLVVSVSITSPGWSGQSGARRACEVILGDTGYYSVSAEATNLRSSLRSLSEVSRLRLSLRLASTPPGSEKPLMLALVIMIVLGTATMLQPSYGHLDNLIPDLSTVRYVTVDIYFVDKIYQEESCL